MAVKFEKFTCLKEKSNSERLVNYELTNQLDSFATAQNDNNNNNLTKRVCDSFTDKVFSRFTKPSRGISEAKVEHQSTETLSFRCWSERCRLMRGAVNNQNSKVAFTLAEVLITLGIIGVVAALTIPTLMANHRKQVVEVRLEKFYSTMNQVIKMAEADYGDVTEWEPYEKLYEKDENGNDDTSKELPNTAYFEKYFLPYMKTVKVEPYGHNSSCLLAYFADGSVVNLANGSFQFWPSAKDFTKLVDENTGKVKNDMENSGIKYFTFLFRPEISTDPIYKYHTKKGVEPYKYRWDGTREMLLNDNAIGCKKQVSNERAYCTALIQMNGWKIPKDYPLRF